MVGGVGSLPGTNFEPGVAKLPDQRSEKNHEKSHTMPGYIAALIGIVGKGPRSTSLFRLFHAIK
jgi:hypothetical protein